MPQIAQIVETYASQVFWMLVVFGLIYFGIGRAMLPKIEATVDARNDRIAGDLAEAERARAEADTTEEAWQAKMAGARADAQAAVADAKLKAALANEVRVKEADRLSATRLGEAEASIRTSVGTALTNIEAAAAEATQDIVARLSGLTVSTDDAAQAVRKVMAHG